MTKKAIKHREKIGARLRDLRLSRGLSAPGFKNELENFGFVGAPVPRTHLTIYHWEYGRNVPKGLMLVCLAKFYDVTVDYLLCRTNKRGKFVDANNVACCGDFYRFRHIIADNMTLLRREKGWSQQEFADNLHPYFDEFYNADDRNLAIADISHWEIGNEMPPILCLIAMADMYKISVDQLFGLTEKKTETSETLGRRIEILRREKSFTRQELAREFAEFSGTAVIYDYTMIGKWEEGKAIPPLDVLMKLAQYFEVTLDYLCGMPGTDAA